MNNKTNIHNKIHKTEEEAFLLIARKDLLQEIRNIAHENHISVSHFLREAAKRNLTAYKKASP